MMLASILVFVHFLAAILLVGVILLQRNEGGLGALSGMGSHSLMSARGAGDALSRATAILATIFIATSLLLAMQNSKHREVDSVMERLETQAPLPPAPEALPSVPAPVAPQPAAPAQ